MPIYTFRCSHPKCRRRGRSFDRQLALALFAEQKSRGYTGIHCPECACAGQWIMNLIQAPGLVDIAPVTVDGSNRADPMELMGKTYPNRRALNAAKRKLGIMPAGENP